MSLRRLVFGLLLVSASSFALADTASSQSTTGQSSMTSTSGSMSATTAAPAKNHHGKAMHHKGMHQVDINTADASTLAKIHGIGKKRAQEIVDYRTKNGNFSSVADLKNITNAKGKPVFSSKAISRLEKRLTIGGSTASGTTSSSTSASPATSSSSGQ